MCIKCVGQSLAHGKHVTKASPDLGEEVVLKCLVNSILQGWGCDDSDVLLYSGD